LRINANAGYQIATGKSNTAAESALQIRTTGNITATKEQYLAWDRPLDIKLTSIIRTDSNFAFCGIPLRYFRIFFSATWKSGLRYTPVREAGTDTDGTVHALNAAASIGRSFPSLPLESVDERFSSSMAFQGLIDAGARKKKRQDKGLLDKMSAVQLLQTYLNRNVL
jgi:hypothetical protein